MEVVGGGGVREEVWRGVREGVGGGWRDGVGGGGEEVWRGVREGVGGGGMREEVGGGGGGEGGGLLERQEGRGPGLHCESVSWRLPQGWRMWLASCQQGEHESVDAKEV